MQSRAKGGGGGRGGGGVTCMHSCIQLHTLARISFVVVVVVSFFSLFCGAVCVIGFFFFGFLFFPPLLGDYAHSGIGNYSAKWRP